MSPIGITWRDVPSSHIREALRLEIKQRFAALHVERFRAMPMRDEPIAVSLAEAIGGAPPHIDFRAAFSRTADSVETVAVGYVIACSDTQVAHLEAD
jgi:hypothetical protein